MGNQKRAKRSKKRKDVRVSLHPLSLEQALGGTMQISAEEARKIREKDRSSRERS